MSKLADIKGLVAINKRLNRVAAGNFGTIRAVGGGVSELKIDVGPGYRVYYTRRGLTVVLLLVGGDKSTQGEDIKRAQEMVRKL